MKTTNETQELKNQIKANFESMTFEEAMTANADLFKQYEYIKGKRSLSALIGYYRAIAKIQIPAEVEATQTPTEPEVTNEPEETPEVEESAETPEIPETKEQEPEEPFTFNMDGIGTMSNESIKSLIENENPTIQQFCIIQESFKIEADGEIVRKTRMYVKKDGSGFPRWNDARATANANNVKSFYKHGNFDLSADGFPIGEECVTVSVMRLRDALQKFVIDRYGATTQVKMAESLETEVTA